MLSLYLVFLFTILVGIGFYSLGNIVLCFYSVRVKPFFYNLFLTQLTGVTAFVVINALWFTGGKTVMTGFVIIAALFYPWQQYPFSGFHIKQVKNADIKHLLLLVLLLAGLFLIVLLNYRFLFPGVELVNVPHRDYVYYAKISYYLTSVGIETNNLEFLYPNPSDINPYNYFLLWLNGGLSVILGTVNLLTLMLITIPYGMFLVWIGLIALGEKIWKPNAIVLIAAFLALFYRGFQPDIITRISIFNDIGFVGLNPWNHPKLVPIFWFLIPVFISILQKNSKNILLFLVCLPIAYFTTTPAVLGSISLFIAFALLNNVNHKQWVLALLLPFLYIFFFYFLFSHGESMEESMQWEKFMSTGYWKTIVNVLGKTVIQVLVLSIPLIAVIALYVYEHILNNKINRLRLAEKWIKQWGIIILHMGFALIGWAVLHFMLDSVQLFNNIVSALLVVSFYVVTIKVVNGNIHKFAKVATMIVFIAVTTHGFTHAIDGKRYLNTQSKTTIAKLREVERFVSDRNPLGVFIFDISKFQNVFQRNPIVFTLGQYLSMVSNESHLVSLSVYDGFRTGEELIDATLDKYQNQSTFNKFLIEYNLRNNTDTGKLDELGEDFIKAHEVEILIIPNSCCLPNSINGLFADTLEYENEIIYLIER